MKTHSKFLLGSLFSAFAIGAGSCAVDDADALDDIEIRTDAVVISPAATASGIQYGVMYTWPTNGVNRVPLISGENNACFINNVWGNFNSFATEVRVTMTSGGQWELSGSSAGTGTPSADAYCIRNVTPTQERSATNGQLVAMGVDPSTHSCFLTKIGGAFDSNGSFVRVVKTATDWVLEVSSGGSPKRGSARCVPKPSVWETTVSGPGAEAQLRGLSSSGNVIDAINLVTNQSFFCSLTKVQGQLTGPDSRWIGTYVKPLSDGTYAWKLGRGPHSGIFAPALAASARCVR
jgi:hypothetical protein